MPSLQDLGKLIEDGIIKVKESPKYKKVSDINTMRTLANAITNEMISIVKEFNDDQKSKINLGFQKVTNRLADHESTLKDLCNNVKSEVNDFGNHLVEIEKKSLQEINNLSNTIKNDVNDSGKQVMDRVASQAEETISDFTKQGLVKIDDEISKLNEDGRIVYKEIKDIHNDIMGMVNKFENIKQEAIDKIGEMDKLVEKELADRQNQIVDSTIDFIIKNIGKIIFKIVRKLWTKN